MRLIPCGNDFHQIFKSNWVRMMEREQEGMNFCDYFLCGGWMCSCGCVHLCTQVLVHLSVFVFVYRLEVNVGIFLNHSPPYWGWGGNSPFLPPQNWDDRQAWATAWFFFFVWVLGIWTQGLMLALQVLYHLGHLPSSQLFYILGPSDDSSFKGACLTKPKPVTDIQMPQRKETTDFWKLSSDLNSRTHSSHMYTK